MQKIKIAIGAVAFAMFIACAVLAYDALRERVSPELTLQPMATATPTAVPTERPAVPEAAEPEAETEPDRIEAPDFTVEDLDGNMVKFSDMTGKPMVINFWASWCPPCKAEMPEFAKVHAELGNQVEFMMINATDGYQETRESAVEYIDSEGFIFPVYLDVELDAGSVYGITSFPTTIFIDSEGYVVTGAVGQISEETLRLGISMIQNFAEEEN